MVKISNDKLKKLIIGNARITDPDVLVGPKVGEDAAIIKLNGNYLAVHSDPITGSLNDIGWLAINVPANDIATRGVRPRWFVLTLLLPRFFSDDDLMKVMNQVNDALAALGGSLIGGHTEYVRETRFPIASTTVMGVGAAYVSTSGLRAGDAVVATKYAAIEATAIAARDLENDLRKRGVSGEVITRASALIRNVSVVKEALIAARYASSMHDPTEGGVIQGLLEMASASGTCINVDSSIPVLPETSEVLGAVGIDPYRSLSSGMLLIGVKPGLLEGLLADLSDNGVPAKPIGKAVKCGKPCVELNGLAICEDEFVEDELMKLLDETSRQ
ncbi:hydrogenase [Thermocladium modestius]|uniref:Hydrogenase n=1 Tax=Thermocladium modestius TaxID=62609 RepID=A0A830GXP3_9CREN|nr:AIR synthase family protein [Thermocladium modestius]GGP21376.1 hydrogenase [Thermocladium modestius]